MRKSFTMALITLLAVLPLMGAWSGSVQAADPVFSGGGNGSELKPYIIKTADDLNQVRDDLTASYKLGADIDLSQSDYDNWLPIGTSHTHSFQGTFDGAGYTISELTIDSNADYIGLFGYVRLSPLIKNVRLENVDITSTNTNASVGGLVGLFNNGEITSSSVSGTIVGVAGETGGLVGYLSSSAKLKMGSSSVNLNISGSPSVGGLVGLLDGGASIEQSYATGDVSLSGGGKGSGGGLVGYLNGMPISNSYATGRVTSDDNDSIGGLVGVAFSGEITNSYAAGIVDPGTGFAGGLIGEDQTILPINDILTSSYWNSDTNSVNPDLQTIGNKTGRVESASSDAMKHMATYAGWDSTIWDIQDGTSYPYLTEFAPAVKVEPLSEVYSTVPGINELTLSGTIQDGSIGEPLEVGYVIQNSMGATVTSAVYSSYATGENQAFQLTTTLDGAEYPDGDYTLMVTWKDTVAMHNESLPITFTMDSTAPEISLNDGELIELQLGDNFTDPGVTTNEAGLTITISGTVDTSQTGNYILTYLVADKAGNTTTKLRTVKVYNSLFPGISLKGLYTMQVEVGDHFTEPGATASDERDGDITDEIEISGSVDTGHVGTYLIKYSLTNSLGYQILMYRNVKVVDTRPPVLTLKGDNPMQLEVGGSFIDPGAAALDVGDGDMSADITVSGSVYTNQVGTFTLTYKVQDHTGNAADAVRTVNVIRSSSTGGGQTGGEPSGEDQTEEDNAESTTPPAPGCSFTDIRKHWAKSEICEAAELGIVEGVNAYTFLPNSDVTRTEFAVMLLRALRIEIDDEAGALTYSDRDSTPKWALQAIQTAVAKEIISGYPDGTLRPMQKVNRSEMAAMVSRAMKWQAAGEGNAHFSDEASIPAWAKGYVGAARERGILTGRDGNRFAPAEDATRAEAAVVLLRLWLSIQ
ncbi:MAG: immunoglobulin-like domain-containing protein [Candidatus Pristimantibacillus sp.]